MQIRNSRNQARCNWLPNCCASKVMTSSEHNAQECDARFGGRPRGANHAMWTQDVGSLFRVGDEERVQLHVIDPGPVADVLGANLRAFGGLDGADHGREISLLSHLARPERCDLGEASIPIERGQADKRSFTVDELELSHGFDRLDREPR